jgi:competence protein ComEC
MHDFVQRHKIIFIIAGVAAAGVAIFLYYFVALAAAHKFRVTFLNIGQGDSSLIEFGNGQKMLVDCGPDATVLFRLGAHLPVFDRTIDYLLDTHTDLDHFGGCASVLERYQVKNVVLNGQDKSYDQAWQQFIKAIADEGAKVIFINGHDTWHIGSTTLEFFSPDDELGLPLTAADPNNYSIVFKLTNPSGKTFLMTGDMEEPLENVVMKKYCSEFLSSTTPNCPALKSDVLKVGHHGSNSGTTEEFLRAVRPSTAIISVGARNTFGHPSPRTLMHLKRASTTVLRTDQSGDIIVE